MLALILPLIQLAANTTLTLLGAQGVVPTTLGPLVAQILAAINPLAATLSSGNTTEQDILAGYAAFIGVLNALQKNTSLPADVVQKIQGYLAASQDALTAFYAASKGFNPAQFTPVTPIQ